MENILALAEKNQKKARQIIKETQVVDIWQSIGAEINLVGSLKTGLLMKNKDIDFHIYTAPISISESFKAISKMAENPRIKKIEYTNLIDTEEACIEWHAGYQDDNDDMWQIDMIHIQKGSTYDGYFEKVAERISSVLTPETRDTILKLKYETPDSEKIPGIIYYQAVIRDGVRNFNDFREWMKKHMTIGIIKWMPELQ